MYDTADNEKCEELRNMTVFIYINIQKLFFSFVLLESVNEISPDLEGLGVSEEFLKFRITQIDLFDIKYWK